MVQVWKEGEDALSHITESILKYIFGGYIWSMMHNNVSIRFFVRYFF